MASDKLLSLFKSKNTVFTFKRNSITLARNRYKFGQKEKLAIMRKQKKSFF